MLILFNTTKKCTLSQGRLFDKQQDKLSTIRWTDQTLFFGIDGENRFEVVHSAAKKPVPCQVAI
ncbi:MAG TPA: hypothetical protein DF774_13850 [Rheinheimera sp.]|nr:hypothetical protein [Rheinheimera sp.]